MTTAYYNEHDPFAAAWLRELIKGGHIADGEVDERDIRDVRPADVAGFRQCHFFAGIGVWSYALRQAGWPDDRPVWTASFPCQPFSAAGKGAGFADERHLWPAGFHLIRECRPDTLLGEQVASKDGLAWLDLVSVDLEGEGYAVGALDTCAAGVGAPHIRQRLYWTAQRLADAESGRQPGGVRQREPTEWPEESTGGHGPASGLADAERIGRERGWSGEAGGRQSFESAFGSRDAGGLADADDTRPQGRGQPGRERAAERAAGASSVAGGLADADGERLHREPVRLQQRQPRQAGAETPGSGSYKQLAYERGASGHIADVKWGEYHQPRPGPTNGFWRTADWLYCRDERWRPAEPGTFPLVDGAPARVGRLRGFGNAIVAPQATAFIQAVMGD